jgi:hypothetical protein
MYSIERVTQLYQLLFKSKKMTVTQLSTRLQNAVLALGMSMLVFSCGQEEIFETPEVSASTLETIAVTPRTTNSKLAGNARILSSVDVCGKENTVRLMAGQNIPVGEVSAYNDDENLYITISIEDDYADDWFIRKTHLYTGEKHATEGMRNPAPGRFPYSNDVISENNTGVQEYTYIIPTADLINWGEFDIALHADVVKVATGANGEILFNEYGKATVIQSEGAWAEGDRFTLKGNWAMYFSYSIQDCTTTCDPIWARNVTIASNGAIEHDVEYNVNNNGITVGSVKVSRGGNSTNGSVTVTFTINDEFAGEINYNKVGTHYSTTPLTSVDKTLFDGGHTTVGNTKILTSKVGPGAGKWEVEYSGVPATSYLTLFADLSGACE